MDLLQLQYFRTIAHLENITKASELLYVAQPNLSVSIKRLEEDLGVALFDRRRGRIQLTPTGKIFLATVEQVLDGLEAGIEEARLAEQRSRQQVCVSNSIVDLMGNLLREFLRKNRDVSFRQINCRNSEIADRVERSEADFGFIFGSCPLPNLEYIQVDACERVVQLAKDHPLAGRRIVSLAELNGQRFICNQARDDEAFLTELGRTTVLRPDVFYECDDNRVEVSMTLSGGGLSIAPVSNFLKLLNSEPELPMTCLRIREKLPLAQLGMIRRSGNLLSGAELQFYEMVATFFSHESHVAQTFVKTLPKR